MPQHRTPHWTDGSGIGKKLTGMELGRRLAELAEQANSNHQSARQSWRDMLKFARQSGEALIEAKRRLGHKLKWSRWRAARFEGSKSTSCDYMKIAREWNDPRLVAARSSGVTIDSISKVLKVLKGEKLEDDSDTKTNTPKEFEEMKMDMLHDELRKWFGQFLRERDCEELRLLRKQWLGFEKRMCRAIGEIDDDELDRLGRWQSWQKMMSPIGKRRTRV